MTFVPMTREELELGIGVAMIEARYDSDYFPPGVFPVVQRMRARRDELRSIRKGEKDDHQSR